MDNYWFGCGSPTSLAFLRIVTGFLSAANLLMLGMNWDDWFSERGFVPRALAQTWFVGDPYVWSGGAGADKPVWQGGLVWPKINLLSGITNPLWAQIFFWGVFVVSILTMFGLWTRLSTFLLAVGTVSLNHRNPMILMGGDTVLRLACLYLALSPCGTVCSVDRLVALWKGRVQPGPVLVSLWVQRLITYNVALVYITTVWLKWTGTRWRSGDAVYYSANLPEFFRFPYPHFLIQMPWVRFLTWGTLLTEFSMGTLVFYRPLRRYVLAAGLMLHAGIEYTMNVPLFGYLMVSWYICFYDGEEVSNWFARLGQRFQRFHITVHLPLGKQLRPNALAVLNAIDPLGLVSYVEGDRDGLYVTRADGTTSAGVWSVMTHSLGAWPFFCMPWIWGSFLTRSLEVSPVPSGSAKPSRQRVAL
jgi:hypothetical protein